MMERPIDVDAFLNDETQFRFQSSGRGLRVADHRLVRSATKFDLEKVVSELMSVVLATMAIRKMLDDGLKVSSDEVPNIPDVEFITEKKAALVWVRMRRDYEWLKLEDLDVLETSKIDSLMMSILNDLVAIRQDSEVADTVPDAVPKEERQKAINSGPTIS